MAYRTNNEKTPWLAFESSANPLPVSMQGVFDLVYGDATLPPIRRRDLLSALRALERTIRRPLASIPCQLRVVRELMDSVAPARFNMSAARWANVRSLVFKSLTITGGITKANRRRTEPSLQWVERLAPLPKRRFQIVLRSFARWCSERDIEPDDVTQEVFKAYAAWMEEYRKRSRPREAYCALVRAWNKAREISPAWPALIVILDNRRDQYALPLEEFPISFQQDIEAMVDDALGRDPLSSRTARPVRPVTAETRVRMIRAFASALVRSGWEIESLQSLADIVTVKAAKTGLRFILARLDGKRTGHPHQHAKLLCTLARQWVPGVGPAQLKELEAIRKRLRPAQRGMTPKNRETLRYFDDPTVVSKFLLIPDKIQRQCRSQVPFKQSAAVKLQVALAVALLTNAPVRCRNLHSIQLDKNLIDVGMGRSRRVHLYFAADDVKNGVELEFTLSSDAVKLLDFYVRDVRPKLLRAPSDYLFPGQCAGPKGPALLSEQIAETVEEFLGVRLTAHQFRHLIGYIYLLENPGGHEVVRQLLGHREIQTTLQFYAGMETQKAIAHYDAFLNRRKAVSLSPPNRAKRKTRGNG